MKKLLFLFLLFPFFANSQDVITLKNGEEINAKVTEVGTDEIKYKKGGDDGPVYVLKKTEIFMVKYKNGNKEVFKSESNSAEAKKKNDKSDIKLDVVDQQLRLRGINDAETYYRGNRSGSGGVIATTLIVSPVIGLIPAIACSSTPPKEVNLRIPISDYSKEPEYLNAYKDQAHRIKKRKVWTAWGVSFGINLALVIVIVAANG